MATTIMMMMMAVMMMSLTEDLHHWRKIVMTCFSREPLALPASREQHLVIIAILIMMMMMTKFMK